MAFSKRYAPTLFRRKRAHGDCKRKSSPFPHIMHSHFAFATVESCGSKLLNEFPDLYADPKGSSHTHCWNSHGWESTARREVSLPHLGAQTISHCPFYGTQELLWLAALSVQRTYMYLHSEVYAVRLAEHCALGCRQYDAEGHVSMLYQVESKLLC